MADGVLLCKSDWSRLFEGLPPSFSLCSLQGGGERGRIDMKEGGGGRWKTDLGFLRHSSSCLSAAHVDELRIYCVFPAQQAHAGCSATRRSEQWQRTRKLFTPDGSPGSNC